MVSSSLLIAANKNERRAKELLMKLWSRIGGRVAHLLKEKGSQCVCARERRERRGRRNRRRCPRRARNSNAEVWQISALRETANAF